MPTTAGFEVVEFTGTGGIEQFDVPAGCFAMTIQPRDTVAILQTYPDGSDPIPNSRGLICPIGQTLTIRNPNLGDTTWFISGYTGEKIYIMYEVPV